MGDIHGLLGLSWGLIIMTPHEIVGPCSDWGKLVIKSDDHSDVRRTIAG